MQTFNVFFKGIDQNFKNFEYWSIKNDSIILNILIAKLNQTNPMVKDCKNGFEITYININIH